MRKAALAFAALLCFSSSFRVEAQNTTAQKRPASAIVPSATVSTAGVTSSVITPARITPVIMPLDQIHEGMKGIALTVFQGVKPESMDVEVLGVMRNSNGPKGDIILVSLHGT
jgi:hypothetical protein